MSLREQIELHLPRLRRYAAAVEGDPAEGERAVAATLRAISARTNRLSRSEAAIELFRSFEKVARKRPTPANAVRSGTGSRTEVASAEEWLASLPPLLRKAALLVAIAGFSQEETALILELSAETLEGILEDAVASAMTPRGLTVLLVEPEPLIAMMIRDLLEALGHTVVGVAVSERESVAVGLRTKPDVLVTETLLDPGDGLAAAARVGQGHRSSLVVVTGSPARAIEAEAFSPYAALVAKPFGPATFNVAMALAAFDIRSARTSSSGGEDPSVAYAPAARVVDSSLQLVEDRRAVPDRAIARLEALRADHAHDARRLARLGHNLGSAFGARMSRVADLLDAPITAATALRIGNQAQALAALKTQLAEELLPVDAADANAFVDALEQFARQMPAWRDFLDEAARSHADVAVAEALDSLGHVLENATGLVSVELAEAVAEARLSPGPADPVRLGYLEGLLRNAWGAIGGYLLDRRKGISAEFNKKVDEGIGGALASGMGHLMVFASSPLLAMAAAIPAQWWWVGPALAAARIATGRK